MTLSAAGDPRLGKQTQAFVLASPWHSLRETANFHFPDWLAGLFISKQDYPSGEIARDIEVPVLILHGAEDQIIPVGQGRQLAGRFPSENSQFYELPGTGHVVWSHPESWQIFGSFIKSILAPKT